MHIKNIQLSVMIYREVRFMAERTAYHLKISGMYCVQCEHRITKALKNIQGVQNINVSYKKAKAEFESDNSVPYDSIVKVIEDEGYKVNGLADSGLPIKEILSLVTIIILYILLQYTGYRIFEQVCTITACTVGNGLQSVVSDRCIA